MKTFLRNLIRVWLVVIVTVLGYQGFSSFLQYVSSRFGEAGILGLFLLCSTTGMALVMTFGHPKKKDL